MKRFEGEVQLVLYHFPVNEKTDVATQVALCAGEQGKFWDVHHLLFRRQSQWDRLDNPLNRLLEFADTLALDTAALKRCVTSGRMRKRMQADKDYGRRLRVQSTPTLFINHQRIVGVQSEAALVRAIRKELVRVR